MDRRPASTTLSACLAEQASLLYERVVSDGDDGRLDQLLRAIIDGDRDRTYARGLYLGGMWLDDIADALLRGLPVMIHLAPSRPRKVAGTDLEAVLPTEAIGAAISGVVASAEPPGLQVVATVNDVDWPEDSEELPEHRRTLETILEGRGVPANVLEVARFTEKTDRHDALITLLRGSRYGAVESRDGELWFRPSSNDVTLLAAGGLSAPFIHMFSQHGVLLRDIDGGPSQVLANAARYLRDTANEGRAVHFCQVDPSDAWLQDGTYALLRSADVVRQDEFHDMVLSPYHRLTPDMAGCVVGHALATAIEEIVADLERYRDSGADPSWALNYLRDEYGTGAVGRNRWKIREEDVELVTFLAEALPDLIEPESIRSSLNVGRGSFSYLDLLVAPLMAPGARQRLEDRLVTNLRLSQRWKEGDLPVDLAGIGPKFEKLIVAKGGELYRGCEALARRNADIALGDIFDIHGGPYGLVMESFVSCSVRSLRSRFWEAQRSKRRAVADGGWLVSLHMADRKEWRGNPDYSGVRLLPEQILEAYRDADLDVVRDMVTSDRKYVAVIARAGRTSGGRSGRKGRE